MRNSRLTLLVGIALMIGACFPLSSKHPLGNQTSDVRLVGTWVDEDGDETQMVITRRDRKSYIAVISSLDEDEDNEPSAHYLVKPSTINGKTYMSVMQVFPRANIREYARAKDVSFSDAKKALAKRDARMNGYYLGAYEIVKEDGKTWFRLAMMGMDNPRIAEAIEDGELKGGPVTVKDEDGDEDEILYLTSSSAALVDFVEAHEDELDDIFDFDILEMVRK